MSSSVLAWCWVAGIAIGSLIRHWHTWPTVKNVTARASKRWVDAALVLTTGLGMFVAPIIHLTTSWLDFANYHAPGWMGWLGVGAFAVADYLLWRSHAGLGLNWSAAVEVREGHTLVTSGIYSRIRHPMYLAHWFWAVAQPLLIQNWIAGLAMLLPFAILYAIRIPHEEQLMLETFGEEYRRYADRTGRCWPRLGDKGGQAESP